MDRAFVHPKGKFTALEAFELGEAFLDLVAEIDQAFGIVPKESPSVGEANGASSPDKKRLAERVLELANGQADSRLSAIESLGSAGETAFFRDCQKNLEFPEIHTSP
jgi:hypothetical protein